MQYRVGESDGTFYRTDRFFQANGEWFFSTREGPNIGPYESRRASQEGLDRFIRCIRSKDFQHNFEYAVKIAKQSLWETTLLH